MPVKAPRSALLSAREGRRPKACVAMVSRETSGGPDDFHVVSNSFLLLPVRHLLLEAMHLFLLASCYY